MNDQGEYPEDRCYHGTNQRIFVDVMATGWTERNAAKRVRELPSPDPLVVFNWGYIGTGPNHVSRAILGDALGQPPPLFLYQAFTADVVSQFPDEFRLRRFAVMRWVRGFLCADHDVHTWPEVIPPADPHEGRWGCRSGAPDARS